MAYKCSLFIQHKSPEIVYSPETIYFTAGLILELISKTLKLVWSMSLEMNWLIINLQRIDFIYRINEIIPSLRQRKANGLPFMWVLEHEYYT
jgi:hypothetical protein